MITLDPHGVAALFLTLAALFLFTRQRLSIEWSSFIILAALGCEVLGVCHLSC
jgi:hypothetical protein